MADPLRPEGDPDVRPPDPNTERPIASFSDERKNAVPLPVKADANPEYESSFDEFAGVWAKPKTSFFGDRGAEYAAYRQAYEFGASIASDRRFAEQSWITAEPGIREAWQKKSDLPWDGAAGEIQRGWNDARGEG